MLPQSLNSLKKRSWPLEHLSHPHTGSSRDCYRQDGGAMLRNLWIDEFAPVSVLREYIPRQRPSAGCRRRHLPRGWQPAAARYAPQPCRSPLPTRFRAEFMVGSEVCLLSNDVRFGSKADMCSAKGHVRFTPESGHSSAWCEPGHAGLICRGLEFGGGELCHAPQAPIQSLLRSRRPCFSVRRVRHHGVAYFGGNCS